MFRQRRRKHGSESVLPEARLWWLLYGQRSHLNTFIVPLANGTTVIPCLSAGLFGFAWTSLGPPKVPWIAPMIFTAIVGIGNVRPPS